MASRQARILNLGKDSFFHFGTNEEMLGHFSPHSIFLRQFPLPTVHNTVNSVISPSVKVGISPQGYRLAIVPPLPSR